MEISNTSQQLRSTTLPSTLFSPFFLQIQINLNKLKILAPFISSTRIHSGLLCLIDLYISVDQLITSSHTQKLNLQTRNKALVEDALAGSTRLMDSYSKLVELLGQMKGNVRVLQFALRRKEVGEYSSTDDGHLSDYFMSRKKAKKNINGCLGSLEQLEKEIGSCHVAGGEDDHLSMVIRVLQEIVVATIGLFRYVLLILLGKPKVDKGFWLITKLTPKGKSSCHKSREIVSDTEIVDLTLGCLWKDVKKKEDKNVKVQMVIERLQRLDHQIEGYEVGLNTLFRKLIQTRGSLLNILAKIRN